MQKQLTEVDNLYGCRVQSSDGLSMIYDFDLSFVFYNMVVDIVLYFLFCCDFLLCMPYRSSCSPKLYI